MRETVTVETRQGRFSVSTRDSAIGRRLFVEEQYEFRFMTEVVELLESLNIYQQTNNVVIDIGANIGVISIGLLSGQKYSFAIAIEPEPTNFRLLERNVSQNGMQNKFVLINKAVSNCAGNLCLELSADNLGDHRIRPTDCQSPVVERYSESVRKTISIPATKLDTLVKEVSADYLSKVGLIWIDVQGHEASVFAGGLRLFASGCPVVSEVWPYGILRSGCRLEEFSALCPSIWSHYYRIEGGGWKRHTIGELYGLLLELNKVSRHTNVVFVR